MKAMSPEIQQITSHCFPKPGERGPTQRPWKTRECGYFLLFLNKLCAAGAVAAMDGTTLATWTPERMLKLETNPSLTGE